MAVVCSTPIDVVWEMSLAQFVAYYKELPEVMKLTNPWGGGSESAPLAPSSQGVSSPQQIESVFASMGIAPTKVEK
tara:strand:+ start:460 stop:687 length:228 start_codon:yes stop_codon:yes gene_type:complete